MKINSLYEYTTPSSQPNQAGGQAPEFGRDPNVLETTGVTATGSIGADAQAMPGIKRRGKGSMFAGIKTSKKFVNTPVTEDEISEEQLLAKQLRKELFQRAKDKDIGNKPDNHDIVAKEADEEYDDEAGMIKTNLRTSLRAVKGLYKEIDNNENCPEWVQEKIAIANDYLVTCWDYMISQHEEGRKYEVNENDDPHAWMQDVKKLAHKIAPQDKMHQAQRERQIQQKREQQERVKQDIENLPKLISQYKQMKAEYDSLGGSNWQYADREQNLSDKERTARNMETSLRHLANRIHAAKKEEDQLKRAQMNRGYFEDQGVAEGKLDELKCWSGYTRVRGVPAGAPGSCKKKTNEEELEEYGNTKKGQKMLTKVHKRAVDRVIKTDDKNRLEPDVNKRDLKTVRKNVATADRAWERMTDKDLEEEKCPECSGPMFSELLINEKKDACYYKVKSRYKVWPSAYASGALVKCRKKGADNWGNKSKK